MGIPWKRWNGRNHRHYSTDMRRSSKFAHYALRGEEHEPIPSEDELLMYIMDGKYLVHNRQLCVYLFGVTDKESSATLRIDGALPYFYVGIPKTWEDYSTEMAAKVGEKRTAEEILNDLCELLYSYIAARMLAITKKSHNYDEPVIERDRNEPLILRRRDGFGFNGDVMIGVMKVTLAHPQLVPKVRDLMWHPFGLLENCCGVCQKEFTAQERVYNDHSQSVHRIVLHEEGGHMCACHLDCLKAWGDDLHARNELAEAYTTCCPRCRMDIYKEEILQAVMEEGKWKRGKPVYPVVDPKSKKRVPGTKKKRMSAVERMLFNPPKGSKGKQRDHVVVGYEDSDSSDDDEDCMSDDDAEDTGCEGGSGVDPIASMRGGMQADEQWDNAEKDDFRQPNVVDPWFQMFARHWAKQNPRLDPLPDPLPTEVPDIISRELARRTNARCRIMPRFSVYEANVDFVIRVLVDTGITPNAWLSVAPGKYRLVAEDDRRTFNTVEVCARQSGITKLPPEHPLSKKAVPLVNMAFDGEMESDKSNIHLTGRGGFPTPRNSAILQWSTILWREDRTRELHKYVFVLNPLSCSPRAHDRRLDPDLIESTTDPPAPIDSYFKYPHENDPNLSKVTVFEYTSEHEMLEDICEFSLAVMPDVVWGHNSNAFDIPFMIERCRELGIEAGRSFLSRLPSQDSTWRRTMKRNRAVISVDIGGITVIDFMHHVQEDKNWGMHNLQTVAEMILKTHKVDLHWQLIDKLFKSAEGRYDLAVYCVYDSQIVAEAAIKDKSLRQRMQLGAMTGTSVQNGIQRGTQYRVFSGKLHYIRDHGEEIQGVKIVLPTFMPKVKRSKKRAKYRGAVVLQPRVGFYSEKYLFKDEILARELKADPEKVNRLARERIAELQQEVADDPKAFVKRVLGSYTKDRIRRRRDMPWQTGAYSTYELLEMVRDVDEETYDYDLGEQLFQQMHRSIEDGSFFEELLQSALEKRDLPGPWNLILTTLDYASLYPSIMMEKNVCISTLAHPIMIARHRVPAEMVFQTPDYRFEGVEIFEDHNPQNPCFVKEEFRRGIVPSYERYLKKMRDDVKAQGKKVLEAMKECQAKLDSQEPMLPITREILRTELSDLEYEYERLDLFQLVIKILMNSIYGFYGAAESKFPSQAMAWTITTVGQYAAMIARSIVHKEVTPAKGYGGQGKVVYGDTDSVMYLMKGLHNMLHKNYAVMVGFEMTKRISSVFKVLSIELEKICRQFDLFTKKRYIMNKILTTGKPDLDIKGIQAKRRDATKLQRYVTTKVVDFIKCGEPDKGIQYYCDMMVSLAKGEVLLSWLKTTGSFTKSIDKVGMNAVGIVKPAMVALKTKYRKDIEIPPAERLSYIIVSKESLNNSDWPKVKEWMTARGQKVSSDPKAVTAQTESIDYALEHGMTYDAAYYLDKLKTTMQDMLIKHIAEGHTKEEKYEILERRWRSHPDLPPHLRTIKRTNVSRMETIESKRLSMGGHKEINTLRTMQNVTVYKRCRMCEKVIDEPVERSCRKRVRDHESVNPSKHTPEYLPEWTAPHREAVPGGGHFLLQGGFNLRHDPADRISNPEDIIHVCGDCRPKTAMLKEQLEFNRDSAMTKLMESWAKCSTCSATKIGPAAIFECESNECEVWSERAELTAIFQKKQAVLRANAW